MNVTKKIEKIIQTKVTLTDDPFVIRIKGTPGGGKSTQESAYAAYEHLKSWAVKLGADFDCVKDTYDVYAKEKYRQYILVEITDPALQTIENILQDAR